jgi:hypothetical protein
MGVTDDGRIDATLFGVSDSELLAIVDDLADENGWTNTYDIRVQLGEDLESPRRTGVGVRLAWLRRYGWLEKGERDRDPNNQWVQTWRLTAMGHALVENPKLTAAFERTLEGLNPAQRLALTRELGEMGQAGAAEIRTALRRQWQRSLGLGRMR